MIDVALRNEIIARTTGLSIDAIEAMRNEK